MRAWKVRDIIEMGKMTLLLLMWGDNLNVYEVGIDPGLKLIH